MIRRFSSWFSLPSKKSIRKKKKKPSPVTSAATATTTTIIHIRNNNHTYYYYYYYFEYHHYYHYYCNERSMTTTVVRRPSPPPPPFPVSLLRSKSIQPPFPPNPPSDQEEDGSTTTTNTTDPQRQQQRRRSSSMTNGKSVAVTATSETNNNNNNNDDGDPNHHHLQTNVQPPPSPSPTTTSATTTTSTTTTVPRETPSRRSVTIVSAEALPPYCSERFYLLSELDVRAHPTVFLSVPDNTNSNNNNDDDNDDDAASVHTAETQLEESLDDDDDDDDDDEKDEEEEEVKVAKVNVEKDNKLPDAPNQTDVDSLQSRLPLYTILYLLWKPKYHHQQQQQDDHTDQSVGCSPPEFIERVLLPAVHRWEQEWDKEQQQPAQRQPQRQPQQQQRQPPQHCPGSTGPQSRQRRPLSPESSRNNSTPRAPLNASTRTDKKYDEQLNESYEPFESKVSLEPHTPSASSSSSSTPSPFPRPPLYLVVDRVDPAVAPTNRPDDTHHMHHQRPPPSDDWQQQQFKVQETLAYELARLVASHPQLRHGCDGITIGVSNHRRAAPGLEACVDAVAVGAKDRRTITSLCRRPGHRRTTDTGTSNSLGTPHASQSLIGLVTLDHHCLLGVHYAVVPPPPQQSSRMNSQSYSSVDHRPQPDGNGNYHTVHSDAVTPSMATATAASSSSSSSSMNLQHAILQTRICAEWNGRGNLTCFARRAHAAWRRQHGLPPQPEMYSKRKIPRRTSRPVSSSLFRRPVYPSSGTRRRLAEEATAGDSTTQGRGRRRRPCVEYRRVDMGPPPGRRRHHSFLTDRAFAEWMWDVVAVLWISSYIGFHFFLVGNNNNNKLGWGWNLLFWIFYPSTWDDVVQQLREL